MEGQNISTEQEWLHNLIDCIKYIYDKEFWINIP